MRARSIGSSKTIGDCRPSARITVSATIGVNVITCVVSISVMTSIVSGGSATRSRKETVPLIAGGLVAELGTYHGRIAACEDECGHRGRGDPVQ